MCQYIDSACAAISISLAIVYIDLAVHTYLAYVPSYPIHQYFMLKAMIPLRASQCVVPSKDCVDTQALGPRKRKRADVR